jgi:hypothetical protein
MEKPGLEGGGGVYHMANLLQILQFHIAQPLGQQGGLQASAQHDRLHRLRQVVQGSQLDPAHHAAQVV